MKRFKRRIPLIVIVIAVVSLLVYGFWPAPVNVDVVIAQRGSFDITVDDDGETRIREKYIVTAPVAGKLMRVNLHAGDPISEGETVLLTIEPLDPTPLDARSLAEAEARVRATEATCQLAESRRTQSEEALELALHKYERGQDLVKTNAISASVFDQLEHGWRMARADFRSADFAVRVADFEHELAKAALIRTRADIEGEETQPLFTIKSTIDGRVLRVFTEDAGVVEPGKPIMELGDPRDLELEIDVLSSAAVRIEPGAKVVVHQWGGEGALEAVVRIVEPAAFLKVSALGVEEKRVNIIADLQGTPECWEALGDGYRIEAKIVVDRAKDVIKVPTGALFRHEGQWHAYKIIDGRANLQPVEVGRSNGLETEILQGLAEDDEVVLHPTDNVVDGIRVAATAIE